MTGFVSGADRSQGTLFPIRLEDYVAEDNPVRVIDFFVDQLHLAQLGFGGVKPKETGRPGYHAAVMLKIYIYGYVNCIQSSRRLERECQRNVEGMWLTGYLAQISRPSPISAKTMARDRHLRSRAASDHRRSSRPGSRHRRP